MGALDDGLGSRPRSITELSEMANEFQWNPLIPFKFWVRAAETIYREVRFRSVQLTQGVPC